jgi:hypothetical protein
MVKILIEAGAPVDAKTVETGSVKLLLKIVVDVC